MSPESETQSVTHAQAGEGGEGSGGERCHIQNSFRLEEQFSFTTILLKNCVLYASKYIPQI